MKRSLTLLCLGLCACSVMAAPKPQKDNNARTGLDATVIVREVKELQTCVERYNVQQKSLQKMTGKKDDKNKADDLAFVQSVFQVRQQYNSVISVLDDKIADLTRKLEIQQSYVDAAKRRGKKAAERTTTAVQDINKLLAEIKTRRAKFAAIPGLLDKKAPVVWTEVCPPPPAPAPAAKK